MEVPYFRSDETSYTDRLYYRPAELIGFADLLLRWPSLGFFTIPFFTVLRKRNDVFGFYLHLYEAKSIGIQKSPTLEQTDDQALMIQCALHPPYTFRLRYEHFYLNFDMLYFALSEVEALEKVYRECTILNAELAKRDPLYVTTRKNIRQVAAMALQRMASCDGAPEESSHSFTDGFIDPKHIWWTGTREEESFPVTYSEEIPAEYLWANLPVPPAESHSHGRKNDLESIRPVIEVLKNMGIREAKKSAKIIYYLYPQLTAGEIGQLYPTRDEDKRTSDGFRERGRYLLGLKAKKKPPTKRDESTG